MALFGENEKDADDFDSPAEENPLPEVPEEEPKTEWKGALSCKEGLTSPPAVACGVSTSRGVEGEALGSRVSACW